MIFSTNLNVGIVLAQAIILQFSRLQVEGSPVYLTCAKLNCDVFREYCDEPSSSCHRCEDRCSLDQARSAVAQSSCNALCKRRDIIILIRINLRTTYVSYVGEYCLQINFCYIHVPSSICIRLL